VRDRLTAPLFAGLLAALALYANCGVGGCPDVRHLTVYQPEGATMLLDRFRREVRRSGAL
jgi:hypothetical protein